MSDETFKVQWSVSLPPAAQYAKGHMLNIRGNSVAEVEDIFDEILRDKFIDKATEVAAFFVAGQTVVDGGLKGGGSAPVQSSSSGGGRTCSHGNRVRREGDGRTGHWVGWFCPLEKGNPNQCKPEFED